MAQSEVEKAIEENRLSDFINQAEADGIGPANLDEFETRLGRLIKAPPPEDQTSR